MRNSRAAPSTVRVAIRRFEAARLSWLLDDVTDAVLEQRLFARSVIDSRRAAAPRRARLRGRAALTQAQAHDAAICRKKTLLPNLGRPRVLTLLRRQRRSKHDCFEEYTGTYLLTLIAIMRRPHPQ